jgi:hypothetical protein
MIDGDDLVPMVDERLGELMDGDHFRPMFPLLFSFAQLTVRIHNSFTIFLRDKSNLRWEFSAQPAFGDRPFQFAAY